MHQKKVYLYSSLVIIILILWFFLGSTKHNKDFTEITKVSLRSVGNKLLLTNQDSTSLVLPIIALENSRYQLSFQNNLYIKPDSLVKIIQSSFDKARLPPFYRIEVIQCSDQEVAYSYEMKKLSKNSIVPCRTRTLPLNCYFIKIHFIDKITIFTKNTFLYVLFLIVFIFLIDFFFNKKRQDSIPILKENTGNYKSIGSFHFYIEQNKLVKEAVEINLSKKECELLAIFVAHPNEIIKREVLTKRVWEDHGVFVGRSLDTYISKLRKKLKEDETVKLINVHGVGYKLEVS